MSKVAWLAPVYNKESWIAETIENIQGQTLEDTKIVFLDDGSTDGTRDIIRHYQKSDKRIFLHCNKKNVGLGKSWNKIISLVDEDILLVASGDDLWVPERSQITYDYMTKNKDKDVFYGSFWFCDSQMNQVEYKPAIRFSKEKLITPRKDGFCSQYIGHFVMAYRRRLARRVPHRENLKVGIDYPLLVDFANKGASFGWTNKVLGSARVLPSGVSISRRGEVNEASRI